MINEQEMSEAAADVLATWLDYIDAPNGGQVKFKPVSATTTTEGVSTFSFLMCDANRPLEWEAEGTFTIQCSFKRDTTPE